MNDLGFNVPPTHTFIKDGDPRAVDKRKYLVVIGDNLYKFCIKTYVVTPHLNCLDETVQMRGHNI